MNTLIKKMVVAIAICFTLISCGKTNTQGKNIPKSATFVLVVNGKSLTNKLPWNEVKTNALFKQLYNDSNITADIKSILDNPEQSGIDIHTDLVLFINKDSTSGYIGLEGSIKDVAAFKAFNQKNPLHDKAVEKGEITIINSYAACVGFTKEKFIYVFDAPDLNKYENENYGQSKKSSQENVATICTKLFDLSDGNSLAKEDRFTTLLQEPGDIHYWGNGEYFYKTFENSKALIMFNLDVLYKGSITAGVVNFENGKVNISNYNYPSDELMKIFKQYGGGKINENLLKRIPAKEMDAVIAMNYKPEAIKALLEIFNVDGLINTATADYGVKLNDLIQSNGGDVIIAFSDLVFAKDTTKNMIKDIDDIEINEPTPTGNFLFATSIGNKDAFNKVLKGADKFGNSTFGESTKEFVYKADDKLFALSNKIENAQQYIAGSTNTAYQFIPTISNYNMGGYINIQAITKATNMLYQKDDFKKITSNLTTKMWNNIIFYGGDIKNEAIHFNIEFNLMDTAQNSLIQIHKYATELAEIAIAAEKKNKQKEIVLDKIIKTELTK